MRVMLASWLGVIVAASLTTLAAIAVSLTFAFLIYEGEELRSAMINTPIITVMTAFPFCVFVWSQVRSNILLSAELQRLVNRDRLTNVATRDYFFSKMDEQPTAYGVSLMVDIDRFKSINDTYGHLAGDAVIQAVAAALREHIRENDIVCRFGGEEFVVFLFDYTKDDGFDAAERLRRAVSAVLIPFEGDDLSVTVSIGGSLKEQIADISEAIKAADAALYRAKTQGRNRTVFASDHAA